MKRSRVYDIELDKKALTVAVTYFTDLLTGAAEIMPHAVAKKETDVPPEKQARFADVLDWTMMRMIETGYATVKKEFEMVHETKFSGMSNPADADCFCPLAFAPESSKQENTESVDEGSDYVESGKSESQNDENDGDEET